MLQWTGGARRRMKAAQEAKLKRQREFFDYRKEKRRRNELGEEAGKLRTLSDYMHQNLHGGESLDILGLRSLNLTPADVNTAANPDVNLPDPGTAALRPKSGDAGGVTVASSDVSTSSVGSPRGDDQNSLPRQPEPTTKSRRIIQEQQQERDCAFAQHKPGVANAAQPEIKKLVNRNTDLPLSGKGRNPVHVGNLQTKKVASTPRLDLSDMISSDIKGDYRGKKRLPLEDYAVFSEDEINAINESIFDQHPQQTSLIKSDRSVADWGDTNQLLPSSLELNNSYDCHPDTPVTGTSDILNRFLSTQKLKNFKGVSSHGRHGRQPQDHNMTGKDPLLETGSPLNSFGVTHNERHNLGFSNPTFNITGGQVKEPRENNFSEALIDMENFHRKQEPEKFDFPDPFVNITSHHVKLEHQDPGFSDPFAMTENHKITQERLEYRCLNPSFNIGDHKVMQGYPLDLHGLSYDLHAYKVNMNTIDQKKGPSSPENDLVTWDSDPRRNASSAPSHFKSEFKREFPALDHLRSVQVRSCDGSPDKGFRQFETCDNIPDMTETFYSQLENMETAHVNFDKLRLPLNGFEDERQHTEATFSSLDDYSPRGAKINRIHFENDPPDWDNILDKKYSFSVQWNCESSVAWDVPRRQEKYNTAHSGGNSVQTRDHDDNSWTQTVAGGTAEHFTDHLNGGMNVMQGTNLSSEMHATIAPEIPWDPEPLLLSQINNCEDFIIVCFPGNEDSPCVDTNTGHLPNIQSINIPLQVFGTLESSSRAETDINGLSSEIPSNRFSREIHDSGESGKVVTAARAKTTTHNKLLLGREDSASDMILTCHQSPKEYHLPLNSVTSSLKKDIEDPSWQVKEPQHQAYSELQSPKIRRLPSNLLAIEGGKIEDGLEHHTSNSDKADQCFSSNVLYDHCDDHAVKHELMHNINEENSLEVCTPLKEALQEDMNGMSTTKADDMSQERLRAENAHDYGCQASFSSQEECSPAFQLNTVEAVLCKLQRPVCSCGSKRGKFSEHGTKNVGTVLLKLQRPTRPCYDGLAHQDAGGNEALQKDIKQRNTNQESDLESEIKPTAECELRSLTHVSISGSRGSLPLSNADRGCMGRSASEPISWSSKEDRGKRKLSSISKERDEETRLSLDDIDAIASSSHQASIQPYQRGNGSNPHSLRSELQITKIPNSTVPAGDSIQYPTSASQRIQISDVPEEEQRWTRISDPPASDAEKDYTPASQRNPILKVPDKEQSHLNESDPPAPTTGVLELPSDAPQTSERQDVIEATEEKQDLNDTQHSRPSTENFQEEGGCTTTRDAAYVKMLESYVVQLKFENNVLRLSSGS